MKYYFTPTIEVADGNGTKNTPHVLIHITSDAAFTMEDSNVSVVDNNGGTITALMVDEGCSGESNNTLCISNSSTNLNHTHYGIRNDGSNQIKIGVNNNFGVDDLKYARNYELTDDDYGQESAVETNLQ